MNWNLIPRSSAVLSKPLMNVIVVLAALLAVALTGWTVHVSLLKATIAVKDASIKEGKSEIALLQTALDEADQTNQNLVSALKRQSDQVEALLRSSEVRRQEGEAAIRDAKAKEALWRKRYDALVHAPPQNPEDACGSLALKMDQYIAARNEVVK